MVDIKTFREIALSFPEAVELPHFEKTSFRVGKKIFATLDLTKGQACLKLSENEQDVFSLHDKTAIFPVPNKWGKQGWTFINLNKVGEGVLNDALNVAYGLVAPKKFSTAAKKPK